MRECRAVGHRRDLVIEIDIKKCISTFDEKKSHVTWLNELHLSVEEEVNAEIDQVED